MEAGVPTFKNFVSEDDIEAAKKKRQEEWERVRKPDQPEEAPEEEYDPRSLFERLEANRVKKQDEFDEAHRLKNMVKGLENDEIEFLETVSRQRELEEQEKYLEEKMLLAEYKSSLVHDRTVEQEEERLSVVKKQPAPKTGQKPVKSQKHLLAGIIRRKSSTGLEETTAKKAKREDNSTGSTPIMHSADRKPANALLPGIADYSDSSSSSSSESSSSESSSSESSSDEN